MATWKKMIIIFLFAVAGIVVSYIGIKQHSERPKEASSEGDFFDKYLSLQKEETSENESEELDEESTVTDTKSDEEEEGTTLTDEPYKEVEVKGSDDDKAIALAKNKWRADTGGVTFNIAKKDGNIYYVSVNDNRTTEVLAWYKIDITSGEVSDF